MTPSIKDQTFFLNQWNIEEDSSIQKSTHIVSTVTHCTRKVNNFSLILLRLAMRPKGLHIKKKHLWINYLLNKNMLVPGSCISYIKCTYTERSPNISGSHSHRQRTASERSNASQTEHKPTHYKAHAGKWFFFGKRLCTD